MCINEVIYSTIISELDGHIVKNTRNRPNASGCERVVQWGKNKGTKKFDRVGYPCRSQNFGLVKKRFNNNGNPNISFDQPYQDGSNNTKYPKVYEALKTLIKEIDPTFQYDSITLNQNFKCEPHYDKANTSPSLIVAFGDYEGGELIVEGCPIDINRKPLIFNGGSCLHATAPFVGDRWSVVYYKIL